MQVPVAPISSDPPVSQLRRPAKRRSGLRGTELGVGFGIGELWDDLVEGRDGEGASVQRASDEARVGNMMRVGDAVRVEEVARVEDMVPTEPAQKGRAMERIVPKPTMTLTPPTLPVSAPTWANDGGKHPFLLCPLNGNSMLLFMLINS